MRALPIRARLTLWYVALLAVMLALFGAALYVVVQRALFENVDEAIEAQASTLLASVQLSEGRPVLPPGLSVGDPEELEQFARIFDADRNVTFDSAGPKFVVPIFHDAVGEGLQGGKPTRRFEVGEDHLRVTTFPIRREGRIVGVLEMGQTEDDAREALGTLLLAMAIVYPATLAIAGLGGAFLARRALAPVDRITRVAQEISADDLGRRLDLRLPDDELGRLADTFDRMIERLEDAFRRQRQFTADASHELRTPLTVMKGQIDVALQAERSQAEYRDVLRDVNDQVDRLAHLTGSLLALARGEAGEISLNVEPASVAALVSGAVEHVRPMALDKGIELDLAPGDDLRVKVDEDLTLQLLLNLLDNAVKYTPSGGAVTCGWTTAENRVELWVRDSGIGIATEHLPLIFDRFYRVDKARSRAEGGVGLGLAISRWIAEAHGGSLDVESEPGKGTIFTVSLPSGR